MSDTFKTASKPLQAAVDKALDSYLQGPVPPELLAAMRYSVLSGGKRIRPLLCLLTCEALTGQWQQAMPAACAVEMIHAYSLIHDDLPALDNDDWRRGKPSNHKAHGEAMAILAGDALQARAFEILTTPTPDFQPQLEQVTELALAIGPAGMCGGQVLDMQAEQQRSPEQILTVYRLKTGALIRAAVRMGAYAGQASPAQLAALTQYAEAVGLAFQIVDDLLDLSGSLEDLGKTPGKDLAQQKATYPASLGIEASHQKVAETHQTALLALEQAGLPANSSLAALANYLIKRTT